MTLDEFDYLVSAAAVHEGREICFHTNGNTQIVGTISKLARYNQRVIGVLLDSLPDPDSEPEQYVTSEGHPMRVLGKPSDVVEGRMSTVFVPASMVIAAEWVN